MGDVELVQGGEGAGAEGVRAPDGKLGLDDRRIEPVIAPWGPGVVEELLKRLLSSQALPHKERERARQCAGWDKATGVTKVDLDNLARFDGSLKSEHVDRRVQRAWGGGFDLAVFASRAHALPAYQLLVAMVYRLDNELLCRAVQAVKTYKDAAALPLSDDTPNEKAATGQSEPGKATGPRKDPVAHLENGERRAEMIAAAEREQREVVREAVDRFLDLVSPDVRTVYFRNEALNRVSIMRTGPNRNDGLRWPEAIRGLSAFDDAPRVVMLEDEQGPTWNESEIAQVARARPELRGRGRFTWREGVTRAWAFRIAWDRSRIAAFCGWRDQNKPHPSESATEKFVQTGMTAARKAVSDETWSSPRVAELALRYLTGWLRYTGLHVVGDRAGNVSDPLRDICSVIRAMIENDTPSWTRIQEILAAQQWRSEADVLPHWTVNAIVSLDETAAFSLTRPPAEQCGVKLSRDYPGHGHPRPIMPADKSVLVADGQGGSVSAQAVCWDTPLIIDDICKKHHYKRGWSWSEQDVPVSYPKSAARRHTSSDATHSEVVVLVPCRQDIEDKIAKTPYAVIAGEHQAPGFFKDQHLHFAQLLGLLAGACLDVRSETGEPGHAIGDTQLEQLREIAKCDCKNCGDLLDEFTARIRGLTGADLCYILRYDPSSHGFHASSVSASEAIEIKVLAKSNLKPDASLKPLLRHALRAGILPAGQGRTWGVYRGQRVYAQVDEAERKALAPPLDGFMFPCRIALPIAGGAGVAADAILWLRWLKTPAAILSDGTKDTTDKDRLTRGVLARTGHLLGVLGAALALIAFSESG